MLTARKTRSDHRYQLSRRYPNVIRNVIHLLPDQGPHETALSAIIRITRRTLEPLEKRSTERRERRYFHDPQYRAR